MVALRLLTALRKAVYFTPDFAQNHVAKSNLQVLRYRAFSVYKKSDFKDEDSINPKPKPKTERIPKITLQSLDNSITVTDLENAERLAKRRGLTLLKVTDHDRTQRPLYKFVKSSTLINEVEHDGNIHQNKQKSKDIKIFYISTKITEHDLLIKMKSVIKLLNKSHKIKILINVDDDNLDTIKSIIEDAVKNNSSIQQMTSKKNRVLLLLTPLLSENKEDSAKEKKENN